MSTKTKVVFVRVVQTGPELTNSFVPSIPISEIDAKGNVLSSGYAHPDAIVTPEEIRIKLLSKGPTT